MALEGAVAASVAREWRGRLIALREAEIDLLAGTLVELTEISLALAHDEALCDEGRRFAALVRDRINERRSEVRALQTGDGA